MLRKIVLIISVIFILSFLRFEVLAGNECSLGEDIGASVEACLNGTEVFIPDSTDLVAEEGLKDTLINWIRNIGVVLSLFAVSGIVIGSYHMIFSSGEEDKVKKGKDVVKWSILGFLGIVSASSIIAIIVNLMYSFD